MRKKKIAMILLIAEALPALADCWAEETKFQKLVCEKVFPNRGFSMAMSRWGIENLFLDSWLKLFDRNALPLSVIT